MDHVKLISDYVLRTYFNTLQIVQVTMRSLNELPSAWRWYNKKNYDGKEEEEKDKAEAEEEEKEETLSQVEDTNKEEVDGQKEENSKVTK